LNAARHKKIVFIHDNNGYFFTFALKNEGMQVYLSIIQHLKAKYHEKEAKAMARMILEDYFAIKMLDVYMGKDIAFSEKKKDELRKILLRLDKYEPIQYILGKTSFCGYLFKVTPDVLIPRSETEELVEWVFQSCGSLNSVLDIGTGSGCIPIAISKKYPMARVVSCDISNAALSIARENNEYNHSTVEFKCLDILHELPDGKFDVIVSNPPYVCPSEKKLMEKNVLDWEPHQALFVPQEDPLLFYKRIAFIGLSILNDGGQLFFEINPLYKNEIQIILFNLKYKKIEIRKDFAGKDRMVKAIKTNV